MTRTIVFSVGLSMSVVVSSATAQTLFGPTPYLQRSDSPLLAAGVFSYYHVQDFEPGTLAPGLTAFNGIVAAPSARTDSVDGDDGAVDGSGVAGNSYFSAGTTSAFEFRFDALVLGSLPTHAGLVWTDVGGVFSGNGGFGSARFEAFDAANISLGTIGPSLLGDGVATGGTAEDRFFGISSAGGISRIVISMDNSNDWEVDHVQYGFIPTPGSASMIAIAALLMGRRRRA